MAHPNFPELHPPFDPQAAIAEANRCLFCFDAPCAAACPTHIDVPRFIKKIASENLMGSAQAILDANVLGLSCSRVCPVDVLCEGACVMHNLHQRPIEIGRLQRRAMDHFYEHDGRLPPPGLPNGKKVACIGGGPASLACAAELRIHGFAVTIFDKREMPGGLNAYGVAEYKFTASDSQKEVDLIRSQGVEFRTGVEVRELQDIEREFDAIFLGVGLGPTQKLNIPGEDLLGVVDALTFIAAYKSNRALPVGRSVVVVGGGNTAIDASVAARRLGADDVYLLYRRDEPHLSAFAFEYEHAKREGVKFAFRAEPSAFTGNGSVAAVECASGARFDCTTVIVSIGQSKLLDLLGTCGGLQVVNGRVVVDPQTGQTSNARYFAGGDCVNGGREVVDAVAEGKRAGRGIARGLSVEARRN